MWDAYVKAAREGFERWKRLVAFDRFHGTKRFTEGAGKVRRREYAEFLRNIGGNPLTKNRFECLVNSRRADNRSERWKAFLNLCRSDLETACAWPPKRRSRRRMA
jgi:hypothetical protein